MSFVQGLSAHTSLYPKEDKSEFEVGSNWEEDGDASWKLNSTHFRFASSFLRGDAFGESLSAPSILSRADDRCFRVRSSQSGSPAAVNRASSFPPSTSLSFAFLISDH